MAVNQEARAVIPGGVGKVMCPYCGQPAVFKSTKDFYGKDYGTNLYDCRPCDAYVTTHGRSRNPKGTLANAETREWRKQAHAAFDPIWKTGMMRRTSAYRWLQNVMHMTPEQAHIGMFDADSCKKLVGIIKRWKGAPQS